MSFLNTVDEAPTLSPYLAYYPSERLDDIEVQSNVDHSVVGYSVADQTVVDPDFEDHSHELDVGTEDTANSSKVSKNLPRFSRHSSGMKRNFIRASDQIVYFDL